MVNSFDFIAPFYDRLARLVFGKSIVDSQQYFLNEIPENSSVLILGGGTGWLLETLIAKRPSCAVWYIEASSKMLAITRRRKLNDKTTLILGTEENIPDGVFDVVITNFYFDLFPKRKLNDVIQKITKRTSSTSMWIATDFVDQGKWWQQMMLKIMYVFFKSVSSIEAMHLPAWEKSMLQHQWEDQGSSVYYAGFIKSKMYKRSNVI
jgi:ubiquinone/menaquinone biosynthesis C-methylase UbiE